jgi:hypothetical protein
MWEYINYVKIGDTKASNRNPEERLMFRTMWSRGRDVVLEGRTIDLGKPGGIGIWNGEGMGRGRSVYEQPGTRVDEDCTTQRGGIPSK